MKDYLLKLIHQTTDNILEADAVEYAIYSGWINLTYNLVWDISLVLDAKPGIVEKFRRVAEQNMQENIPLLELTNYIMSDFK